MTGINVARNGAYRREITDLNQQIQSISAFFRFVFRLFLRLAQRHGLLERLAHVIQALVVEVVHPFGPFGIQVDQLVVTHGMAYVVAGLTQ